MMRPYVQPTPLLRLDQLTMQDPDVHNFALRIKDLPSTRKFYRGPAGEALGIGVGDIY